MAKRQTWYDQGYKDGCDEVFDPPYQPGHRCHDDYVAGNADGLGWLETERYKGDYYGSRS
jgi:hypothetical protein